MFQGELLAIFIGGKRAKPLTAVQQIEAVAGRGLVGDRYCRNEGTFSRNDGPDREVTLIESEAMEGLAREYEVAFNPADSRRNLLTRGVPLNHLVGVEFHVGVVLLRGERLCEPCGHLEKLTKPGVEKGLKHRGGLRAAIIKGGVIRQGDLITPSNKPEGYNRQLPGLDSNQE